jgi:hypothetical protein
MLPTTRTLKQKMVVETSLSIERETTDRQTNRPTDLQRDRQKERQTDKQTDRKIHRQRTHG